MVACCGGRVQRALRARRRDPSASTAGTTVTEVASMARTATASDGPRIRKVSSPLTAMAEKLTATARALATMARPILATAAVIAVLSSSPARSRSR